MRQRAYLWITIIMVIGALGGCGTRKETGAGYVDRQDQSIMQNRISQATLEGVIMQEEAVEKAKASERETIDETETAQMEASKDQEEQPLSTSNGKIIAIDAGHQAQGNSSQEPIGPGAGETKAKVASGTSGVSTGVPEYQLTLAVSLKLQTELEARGYQVVMIRTTNEVDISNAERAQVAGDAGAAAFVRIHANGVDNSDVSGALTMCMSASNPYNAQLYQQSRSLSDNVIDQLCAATGANNQGVMESDTMSGINWCTVPVTIVEMGYMTNPTEDQLMESDDYQTRIVQGIANGIDQYFGR